MISLTAAVDHIEMYKDEEMAKFLTLESRVRELYHRTDCTETTDIFQNSHTRAVFKKLIEEIADLEYDLLGDCPISSNFSTNLGFECECSNCQHGPVNVKHYEELAKIKRTGT